MSRYSLPCIVASSLLLCAACSSAPGKDPTARDARIGEAREGVTEFNPCDPAWQLPTADRGDPVDDDYFRQFENELAAGGALWIGSLTLPKPYRAIVEVDVYASTTKKLVDSHLWYLAAIPIDSTAALAAVDAFRAQEPVDAKKLGFCLGDNTFIQAGAPVPPNNKIIAEVTKYDPRCVCDVSDGQMNTVE